MEKKTGEGKQSFQKGGGKHGQGVGALKSGLGPLTNYRLGFPGASWW